MIPESSCKAIKGTILTLKSLQNVLPDSRDVDPFLDMGDQCQLRACAHRGVKFDFFIIFQTGIAQFGEYFRHNLEQMITKKQFFGPDCQSLTKIMFFSQHGWGAGMNT